MAMACRALVTQVRKVCGIPRMRIVVASACSLQRHLWVWCDTCTQEKRGIHVYLRVVVASRARNHVLNIIVSKELLLLIPLMRFFPSVLVTVSTFYHFRAFGLDNAMSTGSGCFVAFAFFGDSFKDSLLFACR